MAAASEHPQLEATKPLLGLLNSITQASYYGSVEITEELLRGQLYPDLTLQEFRALQAKITDTVNSIASADINANQLEAFLMAQMTKPGGIMSNQTAAIAKFGENHRVKIQDSKPRP